MSASPKLRSGSFPRHRSVIRWTSNRNIILIIALILLLSSGTTLMFHIMTKPKHVAKSKNCSLDSDYTNIELENAFSRNHNRIPFNPHTDRPRAILQRPVEDTDIFNDNQNPNLNQNNINNNNIDFNNDNNAINNDNNNNGDQPPPPQQMNDYESKFNQQYDDNVINQYKQEILNNPNRDYTNNENGNENKKTNNETNNNDPIEVNQPSEPNEPVILVPFEETIPFSSNNEKYLTYLPYAGITNQFYGLLRGLELAKRLNRTLIIPPITASSHDKSKQNQPWSRFFNLRLFSDLAGAKVVEFHQLRDVEKAEFNELSCGITCGFGSKREIDFTAKGFLKQFKFNTTMTPLNKDTKHINEIASLLSDQHHQGQKLVCITNTYKIMTPEKKEWENFGQHLFFTEEIEMFVQDFLKRNLITLAPVYDERHGKEIVPLPKYIAIHIRRGDFSEYCYKEFSGPRLVHCLPSTEQIQQRVDMIQDRYLQSTNEVLPVLVATNEKRPEELKKFADLGWRYLDHEEMGTAEQFGVFGPMMVDQVFMANAEVLIGIHMSTFSRVGALRQRDWRHHKMEYM